MDGQDPPIDEGASPAAQEPKEGSATAVGSLASLGDGDILLPGFVAKRPEGLCVDAARAAAEGGFIRFADRVFSAGARFSGLDYDQFLKLLHGGEVRPGFRRLAGDIVPFEPERRALYKAVKIIGKGEGAEYVFEPAFLEKTVQEPVLGTSDEGETSVVGMADKTVKTPTKLDFDEFVADLWVKGIRFGIDAAAVRRVIEAGETTRMEVARWLEPTSGRDASIEEQTEALHRDNSPRILANGRADLRQFKNRFPQIAREARLLKKVPRVLGKPGRRVTGELIEPPLPVDFDLAALAGPGTRVERTKEAEYIVSDHDGFLNLDTKSNQVSVTDKIVSREGISLRTTGNLSLAGDEFEEHGEVQEHRVVEGKHMTFHADVFGTIVSAGGRIRIVGNIAGGKAISPGGAIEVSGRTSRSRLEARDGEVKVGQAEGSLLIGDKVTVERAVHCQIVANTVEIASAEGCFIAARSVHADVTKSWRDTETRITMLVPDYTAIDRRLSELKSEMARLERSIALKSQEIDSFKAQPEVASYLALEARIRQGAVSLTPAQEESWNKAVAQLAPVARRLTALTTEIGKLWEDMEGLKQELGDADLERVAAGAGISCALDAVMGETMVRTLRLQAGVPLLAEAQVESIRAGMKKVTAAGERMFSGDRGRFSWRYADAEEAPAA